MARIEPINIPCVVTPLDQAMPLRDYFAAKAMAAIIAHPGMEPDDNNLKGVSDLAYDFADAMMAERDKRP